MGHPAPPLQKEILENDLMQNYFARLETGSPEEKVSLLRSLSREQRDKLILEMARRHDLPPEQRQLFSSRFHQFFELTEAERQKTLRLLPAAQRQQTQQALQSVERLPEDQRRAYFESLSKFTSLTPAQQKQFLVNVERWKTMSPVERQKWRAFVTQLPPSPPPFPPLPPTSPHRSNAISPP
jgi:type II secretory pathway component PulJ